MSSSTDTPHAVTANEDGVKRLDASAPVVVDRGQGERSVPEPVAPAEPEPVVAAVPETPPEPEDFEAMFLESAASEDATVFRAGDQIEGVVEVISLHGGEIFLDIGGRATGYVMKEELLDAEGALTVKQGDSVKGVVVGTDANGIRIRHKLGGAQIADMTALMEAKDAGLAVEGKITGTNKGGFEITVGGTRAFCPMSQLELYRIEEPDTFIGQTFSFRVIEVKGREAVLSRTALLKAEQAELAVETRKHLKVGATMKGRIRNIQKFGAFVDLGGIDGLVHVSELSWGHVNDPNEVVKLGQEVEVFVLEIDEAKGRIALSLRRTQEDPYEQSMEGAGIGDIVEGKVARLTNFGAFIELGPGVDGLIHISDLAHFHVRSPADILTVGDRIKVKITAIDLDSRRIGLSLKALAADPWDGIEERYPADSTITGTVRKVESFGVFVELEAGITALLPASESGVPQGQPLTSAFRPGKSIEARVLRIDTAAHRFSLSLREPGDRPMGGERRNEGGGGGRPGGGRRPEGGGRPGGGGPRREGGRSAPRNSEPRTWKDAEADTTDGGLGSLGAALLQALGKNK